MDQAIQSQNPQTGKLMTPVELGLVGVTFPISMVAKKVQAKLLLPRLDRMRIIVDIHPIRQILQPILWTLFDLEGLCKSVGYVIHCFFESKLARLAILRTLFEKNGQFELSEIHKWYKKQRLMIFISNYVNYCK